jgi:hypothetical protein
MPEMESALFWRALFIPADIHAFQSLLCMADFFPDRPLYHFDNHITTAPQ